MDLFNKTSFPAEIFYTIVGEDRLMASVVLRATFRVEGGQLVADPQPTWPVDGQPFETEFGAFDADTPFAREGVDVFVLGNAYPAAPQGRTAQVEIRLGSQLAYGVRVFGDRRWVRDGEVLRPSDPEPFAAMPVTWERAYGGESPVAGMPGKLPWHANPKGRGFYVDAESAEGQLLPNLEDPDHLIREWGDQPEPRATAPCPREFSLRALNSAEFDMESVPPRMKRLRPAYFNNANPRLILARRPVGGEQVSVSGMRPGGAPLEFPLPDLEFHTYVQLAERRYVFPSHLDAIAVFAEEQRVVIGHRCCFRYRMVPLERRAAVLYDGPAPTAPPTGYRIDWERWDAEEPGHA
jgi:hypothetical protein